VKAEDYLGFLDILFERLTRPVWYTHAHQFTSFSCRSVTLLRVVAGVLCSSLIRRKFPLPCLASAFPCASCQFSVADITPDFAEPGFCSSASRALPCRYCYETGEQYRDRHMDLEGAVFAEGHYTRVEDRCV
jgi:hypothetical protein